MSVENQYKSQFKLNSIFVTKSAFQCKKIENLDTNLYFDFDNKINYLTENTADVELTGLMHNKDNKFSASATIKANFTFDFIDGDDEIKNEMFERNAVSIIFPYLRSYFTLLTCTPELPPVVIPPINILAFLADKKNNK